MFGGLTVSQVDGYDQDLINAFAYAIGLPTDQIELHGFSQTTTGVIAEFHYRNTEEAREKLSDVNQFNYDFDYSLRRVSEINYLLGIGIFVLFLFSFFRFE